MRPSLVLCCMSVNTSSSVQQEPSHGRHLQCSALTCPPQQTHTHPLADIVLGAELMVQHHQSVCEPLPFLLLLPTMLAAVLAVPDLATGLCLTVPEPPVARTSLWKGWPSRRYRQTCVSEPALAVQWLAVQLVLWCWHPGPGC